MERNREIKQKRQYAGLTLYTRDQSSIGYTTEAIRLFCRQIAMLKSFPLELSIPNQLTASVLAKSDKNQDIETFDSPSEL